VALSDFDDFLKNPMHLGLKITNINLNLAVKTISHRKIEKKEKAFYNRPTCFIYKNDYPSNTERDYANWFVL